MPPSGRTDGTRPSLRRDAGQTMAEYVVVLAVIVENVTGLL